MIQSVLIRLVLIIIVGIPAMTFTITKKQLSSVFKQHPFSYDLGITLIEGKKKDAAVTICCHGYGHNAQIAEIVAANKVLSDQHLIGFNFPDYGITAESDHRLSTFGTIDEMLPLLYILKCCACDNSLSSINLYGFSAGGGAIINALATLNTSSHDERLTGIGISAKNKQQILSALENGIIILDCPLKSMREIIDFRGSSIELEIVANQYTKNNMNPIDQLPKLTGLKLNILLYFQKPDEILGNRDDALFIERLNQANSGKTTVVIANEGGHNRYHASLWRSYKKLE